MRLQGDVVGCAPIFRYNSGSEVTDSGEEVLGAVKLGTPVSRRADKMGRSGSAPENGRPTSCDLLRMRSVARFSPQVFRPKCWTTSRKKPEPK